MSKKKSLRTGLICLLVCLSVILTSCAVGIENAEINEDGELILTYTDGTVQNLWVVVGADGAEQSISFTITEGCLTAY